MKKFPLKHLLLYSKGWYKTFNPNSKNKTIWDDMKAVFTADGFSGEHMSRNDMISILLGRCQELTDVRGFELRYFVEGISKEDSWKSGYFVKDSCVNPTEEEYDYLTAILYYCLSQIRFMDNSYYDKLPRPDYKNCLPKRNGITEKTLKDFFDK